MPPFIQRSSSIHNKPTAVASGALRSSARGGGLSADARVAPDGDRHVNQRSRSSAALQTGSPRATVDRARHDALLPASEPSVGRRTPPATVDRGAGADVSPTGVWRRGDDGRCRMDRADPIVRTIEGAARIDPFSRVGVRVPPAAGTPGARRGAATSAAPVVASIPASGVTSTGTSTGASISASSVASDGGAWPRSSTPTTRNVDPRRMSRAQLERAGLYPLVDDDAPPSAQPAPDDAAARRASRPDAGVPKRSAGTRAATAFPTVAPPDRIVTTEGVTRVGWADSIDRGVKR